MSGTWVSHAEKLAISHQILFAAAPFIKISPFTLWGSFNHIVATLLVEDVNGDANDELVVELVSRLTPNAGWFPIMTFNQLLGNTTDVNLLEQTQAINKDSVFGWGGEVAVRATVGIGGTEDFTFSFHVVAN